VGYPYLVLRFADTSPQVQTGVGCLRQPNPIDPFVAIVVPCGFGLKSSAL
jgi:hypothetical protein